MSPPKMDTAPAARSRLRDLLISSGSFRYSEQPFELVSGALSHYYVDCKLGLSDPELREIAGSLICDRLGAEPIDAVGGLIIGAYPIAIAVSDVLYRRTGRKVVAFVVRKQPKEHGRRRMIEGDVQAGQRVLIVDDVITSGQSTVEAIQKSRQEGLDVRRAIALVDREEQSGRARIEAEGVRFEALVTLRELRELVDPPRP